jgi:hypothetical protein
MNTFKVKIYQFLLFLAVISVAATAIAAPVEPLLLATDNPTPRFIPYTVSNDTATSSESPQLSPCVLDRETKLIWEVKTSDKGYRHRNQTYAWYEPDATINGGFAGYKNAGNTVTNDKRTRSCELETCNTNAYVNHVNKNKLCHLSSWRLPTREELRSIVDYRIKYPGPTIDQQMFPHTLNQFYWSSTPDVNDKDSAWGIGFSFGYDYAYFKNDHGYIRLVSEPEQ